MIEERRLVLSGIIMWFFLVKWYLQGRLAILTSFDGPWRTSSASNSRGNEAWWMTWKTTVTFLRRSVRARAFQGFFFPSTLFTVDVDFLRFAADLETKKHEVEKITLSWPCPSCKSSLSARMLPISFPQWWLLPQYSQTLKKGSRVYCVLNETSPSVHVAVESLGRKN